MLKGIVTACCEQVTVGCNVEHEDAQCENGYMDQPLRALFQPVYEPMGVSISEEQDNLEKKHACDPDRCRTAEPRQKDFCYDRLHLEQQKSAQKNRENIGQFPDQTRLHQHRAGWPGPFRPESDSGGRKHNRGQAANSQLPRHRTKMMPYILYCPSLPIKEAQRNCSFRLLRLIPTLF